MEQPIDNTLERQTTLNLLPSAHLHGETEEKEGMSGSPRITRDLIRQAKRGNRQAISVLYRAHSDMIYRYILVRVNDKMLAEDLTADVFTKMVEGLSSYRLTGAPFEAWLYRIASARVVDHRRKQTYRQHSEINETSLVSEQSPEDRILEKQEAATLQYALTRLNEQDRLVIMMRFVERKSHKEVADLLGKSEVTVRSIQHRALSRLATEMGLEDKS
ncbi:MAG: sigma-70 family RNA polymerase sigma factor [Chloroflexota bacterium]